MTTIVGTGQCRVCGCTDLTPCIIREIVENQDGDAEIAARCAWMDVEKTLCSNFRCIAVTPLDELLEMQRRQLLRLAGEELFEQAYTARAGR